MYQNTDFFYILADLTVLSVLSEVYCDNEICSINYSIFTFIINGSRNIILLTEIWLWTLTKVEEPLQKLQNPMKIKEWYHVSLTSNISAKTWSNCTCVLKMLGPADFKSVPGFENWPRFVGVIEQNFFPLLYNISIFS